MVLNTELLVQDDYLRDKLEELKIIYSRMRDKKSKQMYQAFLNLIATKDFTYLAQIHKLNGIKTDKMYLRFIEYNKMHSCGKKIIFYGIGERTLNQVRLEDEFKNHVGYCFFPFLSMIPITAFCDRDYKKYPKGFRDRPVISPQKLKREYADAVIIISTVMYYEEIRAELLEAGIKPENIYLQEYVEYELYERMQYFEDYMKSESEGFFVDGGCCNGQTSKLFSQWQSCYKGILAFEPDKKNFNECRRMLKTLNNGILYPYGLGNKEGKCGFVATGSGASYIDVNAENYINIKTLDSIVQKGGYPVTFIKLDVEGAELDALKGAKKCIQKNLPKLAISAYHKKYDLIELPIYVMSLSDKYRFNLGIYSNGWFEIVLYAFQNR